MSGTGALPPGKRRQAPTEGGLDIFKIGGNIYEAYPATTKYLTGTGLLQTATYQLPRPFRLNKVEASCYDGNDAPTGAAWIFDVELQGKDGVWRPVVERAVTMTNIVEELGVEHNYAQRAIRIRYATVTDYHLYPMFTLQYMEGVPG